jgi:hypothetical protein
VLQYRIVHLMVLPVLLVFLLAWLDSKGLLPTHRWSEKRTMVIDFEVTDGSRPLDGVVIEVFAASGDPIAFGSTGPDGLASLVGEFDASGTAGIFGKKNDARIQPFRYTLNRTGYQPVRGENVTGHYLGSKTPHPRYRWGLTPIDPGTDSSAKR